MIKKKSKRLIAVLMSGIMLLGILPVLPGGSITAYAAEPNYSISTTAGDHMIMTSDHGTDGQIVTSGSAMKNVVYKAKDGYYFPQNYGEDINGVTVARIDSTSISVSGWPTANMEIALEDASANSERPTTVTLRRNINLNASVLITNLDTQWNSNDGATVYYGQYDNKPVLYRVLEADGDTALLDSDKALYKRNYNSLNANSNQRSGGANEYNGSELQRGINGLEFYENTSVFSSLEQDAILKSYLDGADSYKEGSYFTYTDYPAYTYIFPLSASEVVDYYGDGETARVKKTLSGVDVSWWMRSANPTKWNETAGTVAILGSLSTSAVTYTTVGVSPAFNLDLSSVLFTSASGASKSSDFTVVGDDRVDDNTWKLTLSDGNDQFKANCSNTNLIAGEENQIEITGISGATVGSNHITAALINKKGEVLYYGKIAEVNAESATVTIPDTANLTIGETYTLQVFSEQVNGENKTDYASNVVSHTFTALEQVADVNASPGDGVYETPQSVELSTTTEDATIYYTTDGKKPDIDSTEYNNEPISVNVSQTIKAIAVKEDMADSKVKTFKYIIKQTPSADNLEYKLTPVTYNKTARELTVTAKNGEELGTITVKYDGSTQAPVNADTYKITVDILGSDLWNSTTDIELGNFTINPKTLTNVSAVIPDVKQDSPLTLENQLLPLNSEAIEEGDSLSGTCTVTLGSTATTGEYRDAKVEVKELENPNYTFTGFLTEQSYTVIEKTLKILRLPNHRRKLFILRKKSSIRLEWK